MFVKFRGFLSNEFVSRVLQQIDKTVTCKIFDNVAFSQSHFKSIYLLQARNIFILDIVSAIVVIVYASFIISLNIGKKQGIEFKLTK